MFWRENPGPVIGARIERRPGDTILQWRHPSVATTFHEQLSDPAAEKNEALVPANDIDQPLPNEAHQTLRALERAFGQSFAVVDCTTGQTVRPAVDGLPVDLYKRLASCEQIASRGRPEILDEVSPVVLFAVPLACPVTECTLVAVSAFVTERVKNKDEIAAAAAEFGVDVAPAFRWAEAQTPWPPKALHEFSAAILEKNSQQQSSAQIKRQMADISSHLLMTFEEITLLHRLTEHLSISKSVTDICELVGQLAGRRDPGRSRLRSGSDSAGHLRRASTRSPATPTATPCSSPTATARWQKDEFAQLHGAAGAARRHGAGRAESRRHQLAHLVLSGRSRNHFRTDSRRQSACSAGCSRSTTPAPATSPTAKASSARWKPA